jgi:Sulfate permease family
VFRSLRGDRRSWLRGDVVAGLTVWAVLVPEALADASIAGVSPVVGLYAAPPVLLLYAAFGSSRHLVTGPMSATAALSAAAVAQLATQGSDQFVQLTVALAPSAIGVMLVGFAEGLGAAKAYAAQHHYEVDADRELLGLGAANLGAGLSSGMVVNGSLSKTAVNGSAGAHSQISGLFVAALTVLTLLFFTRLFETLPEATLAAVVIAAVIELIDIPGLVALYRVASRRLRGIYGVAARPDFLAALAALLGVFDTLPGLFIGIAVSLLLLLYRASRPHIAVLGQVPGAGGQYGDVARHPENQQVPGVVVLRLERRAAGRGRGGQAPRDMSAGPPLAAAGEGHLGRHHGHGGHVRVQGQAGHVAHGPGHVGHVHARLGADAAVGLEGAGRHALGHLGGGVADVDLAAGDVVGAPVQRRRSGQPGDGVLGGGVGGRARAGDMGRDGAVVDDAAAAGPLAAHDPERLPGAEERAGQVDRDHRAPLAEGDLVELAGRGPGAGVVEEEINAAMPLDGAVEQGPHRRLVGDVGRGRIERPGQAGPSLGHRGQRVGAAAGQHHHPALAGQGERHRRPDAAAGAGDDRDPRRLLGHRTSLGRGVGACPLRISPR